MAASEWALRTLAFVLTYAIHSTLLLGLACLIAPRLRSLVLRERVWRVALLGALVTSLVQVAARLETPLFHWTLRSESVEAALRSEPASSGESREELAPAWSPTDVAQTLCGAIEGAWRRGSEPRNAAPARVERDESLQAASPDLSCSANETAAPIVERLVSPRPWTRRIARHWREWTERGLLVWAGFVAVVLAGFGVMWLRLARHMRGRVELERGELRATLERLLPSAFPNGRRVRLFVAPELRAPVSLGFFQYSICVPPRTLDELSSEEQETMLAHELAHLMRRDPLWLSAAWLIERVFFFQPLNRVARAELHDVAELACDDWAARRTGNRLALASCLARIAGWIIGAPAALPATSMADGHGRCRLSQRIERLLDDDAPASDESPRRWVLPSAAGSLACLVLVVPGVSAPAGALAELATQTGELGSERSAAEAADAVSAPTRATWPELEPRAAPAAMDAVPATSQDDTLELDLELLDESVGLLREELALLRGELESLELDSPEADLALQHTLEQLETRVQNLERRRDQLRALAHVLETHPKTPAHPSSASSTTEVP
ncbi:MAG: M56 family metallopeptidase [Planctomycetes bacterium]|nr:M56 family metallopeptidase [Planctomycetota bacterium]